MKLSFISSTAIQNAMRQTMRSTQNQLTEKSQEATTGVYADIGVTLGGNTAQSVDLNRELSRIDAITASNSIVDQRLSSSQQALSSMSSTGQDMLNQLIALQGDTSANSIAQTQQLASSSLQTVLNYGNTMVNGEYLFAGINTDVQPLTDQSATAVTAIRNGLQAYATAQGTTVDQLTGDQMNSFITSYVAPAFSGVAATPAPAALSDASGNPITIPDWSTWSSASNQNMTSRINSSETVASSTNTNEGGIRYLALASVMTSALMGQGLGSDALSAVSNQAVSFTSQGINGLTTQQSALGLSQARVSKANDALSAQKDIFQNRIVDLTGVDKVDASTQVNLLETQLETAYTIVAKIQQLSLVNYL